MVNITRDEAIYFLDMIDSYKSPNFKPMIGRRKPYYIFLKDRESKEYIRFIEIYKLLKNILSEREYLILDLIYGLNQECAPLHIIGEEFNIVTERVRQIRNKAERRLANELTKRVSLDAKI
jgi:DNA-directed RNA polymerase specialized sigma subunit